MSLSFLKDDPEFRELVRVLQAGSAAPEAPPAEPRPAAAPPVAPPPRLAISGLNEPAAPYFFTMLALEAGRPIVLIRPADRSLSDFEDRARFFFAQLGAPTRVRALPPLAENPYQGVSPPLDARAARMRFFYDLLFRPPRLVVTNLFGLLPAFPPPDRLPGLFVRLERGAEFGRDRLVETLAAFGYTREDLISFRGEYARRGGIVDVYSPWQAAPFRIEFSGDDVASIREFDPATQRSIRKLETVLVPSLLEEPAAGDAAGAARAAAGPPDGVPFSRHLAEAVFVVDHPEEVEREYGEVMDELRAQAKALAASRVEAAPPEAYFPPALWEGIRARAVLAGGFEAGEEEEPRRELRFPFQSVPRFDNKILFFLDFLRRLQEERERTTIFLSSGPIRAKLRALLEQNGVAAIEAASPALEPRSGEFLLCLGDLGEGFAFPRARVSLFAERDIFTEEKVIVSRPAARPSITQFQDLKAGDHVVHADYGVGVFEGLVKKDIEGHPAEFMELRYRDDDRLFVPVEDLNLVQKFTPVGEALPPLDKLGTEHWLRTKERTRKAVEKLAQELLELYARRKAIKGFAFSPEGSWQEEFERTFEYKETEDQLRSLREIKADMETEAPMDRLLCGDVGYGKTEVALRAAFKAVMDGKQVAVLCPTTVLASQHFQTFSRRLVLFPVRVAALSRLQPAAEQKAVVEDLRAGRVDVVVGTHRILSKDVEFRDLGLLVVDEEQRFGVGDKERIKALRASIDVLTLTATPIPRTLNMSLTGLRDISLIETPPRDRLAVQTVVTSFSPRLVATAVRQELNRGGQVYYVLNKIDELESLAAKIREWVPSARVVSIHGQLRPAELERRMLAFIGREADVLVSTTIIENGIDIPLVNTLLVHRADRFGLAQLYQLRGRVGRSSRQAYAYFLVPPFNELTPLARRRLEALKEFSELGSGFRLAMKDLEIRGAGNLFGARQHGAMEAVGYDYFVHLLEQAIRELKGEAVEEVKSEINLKADVRIPAPYLPQANVRLGLYKRVSSAERLEDLDSLGEEIRDRFGPPPPSVVNLLHYGRIKLLAQKLHVRGIDRVDGRVVFKFLPTTTVALGRMTKILDRYRGTMTPQGVMSLELAAPGEESFLRETTEVLKALYGV